MKIVTWNCNGGFREKLENITNKKFKYTYLEADIYVIQECEDPQKGGGDDDSYYEFAGEEGKDYFWVGNDSNLGLGIFNKSDVQLKRIEVKGNYEHFIALEDVNGSFKLLAVWAMDGDKKKGLNPHVEMIHDFIDANPELFDENLIMCGDFNSNVLFNYKHKAKDDNGKHKNHTNLNKKLNRKGLYSAYHKLSGECNGEESRFTFFQARHLNVPYHLDYFYVNEKLLKKAELIHFWKRGLNDSLPNKFKILDKNDWVALSDHLPVVFEFNEKRFFKRR